MDADYGKYIMLTEHALKHINIHDGMRYQEIAIMQYLIEKSKLHYTCNRPPGAAGAIIVTQDYFIFSGVFPPDGSPNCKEVGCMIEWSTLPHVSVKFADGNAICAEFAIKPHCVRTIHAEQHAIFLAAKHGISTDGATIYSVLKPCYQCSKAIIAAGIKKIYYAGAAYDEPRTTDILLAARVSVDKLDIGLEYGQ